MKSSKDLVLALPSKGQLGDKSQEFLRSCGFNVTRGDNARAYTGRLTGISGVGIMFFRPDEIPARVEAGDAHVGITGEDLFRENLEEKSSAAILIKNLGYGTARLVVAVPNSWIDVRCIEDLEEVAVQFRRVHGHSIRVATKFTRLTRDFFRKHGITDYQIVNSIGATEGTPSSGMAELIVDLTSTGATIAQNHLKEISAGTVLESSAGLVVSTRVEVWTESRLRSFCRLVDTMEARLEVARSTMIHFSVPRSSAAKACVALVEQHGCNVPAEQSHETKRGAAADQFVERVAICPQKNVYGAVTLLRELGSTQVLVQRPEFIYRHRSSYTDQFQQMLKRRKSAKQPSPDV